MIGYLHSCLLMTYNYSNVVEDLSIFLNGGALKTGRMNTTSWPLCLLYNCSDLKGVYYNKINVSTDISTE